MTTHNSKGSVSTTSTANTVHSGKESLMSNVSNCPEIILDSSSPLYTTFLNDAREFSLQMRALDVPIKTIDLSPRTESAVGPLLADVTLGTKVRTGTSGFVAGRGELKSRNVRDSLSQSLVKTQTSRLGYLIAQRPDAEVSIGEIAGGFGGLVNEGIIEKVCIFFLAIRF
jgi:hypothetical protein